MAIETQKSGVSWQNFKSAPYDLAAVRSSNEKWAAEFRPRLVIRDEEKRLARIAAAELEAEKIAALKWCRENGSPHTRLPNQEGVSL